MIKTLSSKTVYSNKWMTVKEEGVEFANGSQGIFGIVEKPDFSLIIPFYNHGFQLVKQYRYPVKNSFWEFPQGSHENAAINPADLAKAELQEETGFIAGQIQEIGFLYEAYGYCNQGFHIYLATELSEGRQQLEEGEQGLKTKFFKLNEFESMIESGKVRDASTISAYGIFRMKNLI